MNPSQFKQKLKNKGYTLYANEEVLLTMPPSRKDGIEIFKIDKYSSDDELEKGYEERNLVPVSPYDLIDFWDGEMYLATHWKDAGGKWCFACFDRFGGERRVRVYRDDVGWSDFVWFAGVRKSELRSPDSQSSSNLSSLSSETIEAIELLQKKGFKVIKEY